MVAGVVLVAFGSSAAEHDGVARQVARLFHDDLLSASETTARRALLRIGDGLTGSMF